MTTAQFALTRDDLSSARLLKVPESAPPFDGEIPAAMGRPVGRLHWFTDRAAATGGAN